MGDRLGTRIGGPSQRTVDSFSPEADSVSVGVGVGVGGIGVGVVVTDGPDVVPIAASPYVCGIDPICSYDSYYGWAHFDNHCHWYNSCADSSFFLFFSSGCSTVSFSGWSHCHVPYYHPTYICSDYYVYRPWHWGHYYHGPVYSTWCSPAWWHTTYVSSPIVYYVAEPAVVYPSSTIVYTSPPPPALTLDESWSSLAAGSDREALEGFAGLMQQAEAEGLAPGLSTVGYALANEALGFHGSAVSAMRSAVRRDPTMLRLVPVTADLSTRLRDMIELAKERTARSDQELDALFMIAAMQTILRDDAAAFYAANQARNRGDTDQSTAGLQSMLADSLSSELYR